MGGNLYQDGGDSRVLTNEFGDTLTLEPNDDVSFFGGIKLGYVFGTGTVRPTLEADLYYNGFKGGVNSTLNVDGDIFTNSVSTTINTGAFMFNGILRFAFGRFQPYIGAGIGFYYAESTGIDFNRLVVNPLGGPVGTFNTDGGGSHSDFAWQAIAGADYYWSPTFSTFIEFKYLEYTGSSFFTGEDRSLDQFLLGAGLRFHF